VRCISGSSQTLCFWGRAKLFGLLGGVLGAARSVGIACCRKDLFAPGASGEAHRFSFWGRAKLFGLLALVFGAACSVCTQTAEKICSPLGLRGKPSDSVSGVEPNFSDCWHSCSVLHALWESHAAEKIRWPLRRCKQRPSRISFQGTCVHVVVALDYRATLFL